MFTLLQTKLAPLASFLTSGYTSAPTAFSVYAELTPSLGYLTSLLEQDSVANLRYGVLFILALSSLGVYSIILAG